MENKQYAVKFDIKYVDSLPGSNFKTKFLGICFELEKQKARKESMKSLQNLSTFIHTFCLIDGSND